MNAFIKLHMREKRPFLSFDMNRICAYDVAALNVTEMFTFQRNILVLFKTQYCATIRLSNT